MSDSRSVQLLVPSRSVSLPAFLYGPKPYSKSPNLHILPVQYRYVAWLEAGRSPVVIMVISIAFRLRPNTTGPTQQHSPTQHSPVTEFCRGEILIDSVLLKA
ncbi:hypothetical protein J6590_001039 [Homalodisca vitripennis]|nr:hypothetical protein J6590_001039 [Homalodisca vitripennis]